MFLSESCNVLYTLSVGFPLHLGGLCPLQAGGRVRGLRQEGPRRRRLHTAGLHHGHQEGQEIRLHREPGKAERNEFSEIGLIWFGFNTGPREQEHLKVQYTAC